MALTTTTAAFLFNAFRKLDRRPAADRPLASTPGRSCGQGPMTQFSRAVSEKT
jgi:hypothetical protein